MSVNPFVTPFDTFEASTYTGDLQGGSIFDRISLGSPKKPFDSILKKENPQEPKSIIAKYTRSVTFEEKDTILPATKENSPEDKTHHPSKELSDDMTEPYSYDESPEKITPLKTKTDVNQMLTKYLLPSRTLEPLKPSTPPLKTNSREIECSTVEKSPKYLADNPSTPKKSAFDLFFNRQQKSFDSGIKERNPFLPKREENKPASTNPIKSVFLRKNQVENNSLGPKKKMIYFVNLRQEGLKLAKNFCAKFNFEFVDNMNKLDINKLDYIVYEGAEVPNTYITALAMLKGKPVIKREWMETSLEENSLDDSDIYEHYYNTQSRKSN